MITFFQIYC